MQTTIIKVLQAWWQLNTVGAGAASAVAATAEPYTRNCHCATVRTTAYTSHGCCTVSAAPRYTLHALRTHSRNDASSSTPHPTQSRHG
jgi:hypothetical protein